MSQKKIFNEQGFPGYSFLRKEAIDMTYLYHLELMKQKSRSLSKKKDYTQHNNKTKGPIRLPQTNIAQSNTFKADLDWPLFQ